jgi:hypothetical protein
MRLRFTFQSKISERNILRREREENKNFSKSAAQEVEYLIYW